MAMAFMGDLLVHSIFSPMPYKKHISLDSHFINSNFGQKIRAKQASAKVVKNYLAEMKVQSSSGDESQRIKQLEQIIDENTKVVIDVERMAKCELMLLDGSISAPESPLIDSSKIQIK